MGGEEDDRGRENLCKDTETEEATDDEFGKSEAHNERGKLREQNEENRQR